MVVVDASVAAKWFLIEQDSKDALKILNSDMKLVGPTLAKYEVAGAFTRRAKDKQITVDDAKSYMDRWLLAIATNVMRLEEDNRDITSALDLAIKMVHVLPDCIYLAMAKRLDVPLVTADEVFAKKARKLHNKVLNITQTLTLAA